jgi:hypothetical protein
VCQRCLHTVMISVSSMPFISVELLNFLRIKPKNAFSDSKKQHSSTFLVYTQFSKASTNILNRGNQATFILVGLNSTHYSSPFDINKEHMFLIFLVKFHGCKRTNSIQ